MIHALGIIGGMGPLATADFYLRLTLATEAGGDQGHIPVIIEGDPRVPDRSDALLSGIHQIAGRSLERALAASLAAKIGRLRRVTCGPLVAPCCSAIPFLRQMNVPGLLDFGELAAGELKRQGVRAVTLMATDGTISAGALAGTLRDAGIEVRVPPPAAQAQVMAAIRAVKAGRRASLPGAGPDALIACTDLSAVSDARLNVSQLAAEAIARDWAHSLGSCGAACLSR